MIYSLTNHVLANIIHHVTDIKDIYHLYRSCKFFRDFITNNLFEIHLIIDSRINLKFLNTISQLKRIYLFRSYLMPLDIRNVHHAHLEYIFTNSMKMLSCDEKTKVILYGFSHLRPCLKEKAARQGKREQNEYVEDIKEYFTMRYNMKKGSKLKYKDNEKHDDFFWKSI